MRILFLGDVTGRSGREALQRRLKSLKEETRADLTVVNGENAAHGKGITSSIYRSLIEAGADVITLGNHAFSKNEILKDIESFDSLVRPANIEPRDAGVPYLIRNICGKRVAVVNLLGSIFMDCASASPFDEMDRLLEEIEADIILVDFHAEATSEKELFWHTYRGRLSAVIGTHTHVQTADEQIAEGCAYITDAGMCGPMDSILGRDVAEVRRRMIEGLMTRYTPSDAPAMICGVLIEVDETTNRAVRIERIQERP